MSFSLVRNRGRKSSTRRNEYFCSYGFLHLVHQTSSRSDLYTQLACITGDVNGNTQQKRVENLSTSLKTHFDLFPKREITQVTLHIIVARYFSYNRFTRTQQIPLKLICFLFLIDSHPHKILIIQLMFLYYLKQTNKSTLETTTPTGFKRSI